MPISKVKETLGALQCKAEEEHRDGDTLVFCFLFLYLVSHFEADQD